MRRHKKHIGLILVILTSFLCLSSCATLQQMAAAMTNLLRLQFKVGLVHDFTLNGINLSRKSSLSDFNALDGIRLVQAFAAKKFPAEIVLDIEAINPNDGRGGSRQTVSTLTSLESRLLIDGVPTVMGNIDRPIEIPGTGQASIIPLRMSIDLYQFFGNKGYEGHPEPGPGHRRNEPRPIPDLAGRPAPGHDSPRADHLSRPADDRQPRIPLRPSRRSPFRIATLPTAPCFRIAARVSGW